MIARPPVWVVELAARFWALADPAPPFPRDLRTAICWIPQLHFLEIPGLTLASAGAALARWNVPCPVTRENRALAGCFAGHRGRGFILVEAELGAAEKRFTPAHEVAHFLRDYDRVRRRTERLLGAAALDALDGLRNATPDERLACALAGASIEPHTHFLDRDPWGRAPDEAVRESETAADRLACELLAPFDALGLGPATTRGALAERLTSEFGLPAQVAVTYAATLLR